MNNLVLLGVISANLIQFCSNGDSDLEFGTVGDSDSSIPDPAETASSATVLSSHVSDSTRTQMMTGNIR